MCDTLIKIIEFEFEFEASVGRLFGLVKKLYAVTRATGGHTEHVGQLPCPEVGGLVSYLETTWLANSNWSVRQWSVFRQTIRTNNDCEGWHRHLNGKAGRAMLHFYLLVPLLRKESNTVEVSMRLVEEQALSRHRRNRYREQKVEKLWSQLEEQTLRTSAFLRAISKLCAPGFPE